MKSKLLNLIVVLSLTSCGQSSTDHAEQTQLSNARIQELAESFKSGKAIFANHCSTCHHPLAKDSYTFDHLFERLPAPAEDYFIRYVQDSKKIKMSGEPYANYLDTIYRTNYEHLFKDTLSYQNMQDLVVYSQVIVKLKDE